ncbi:fumarylacetoacetate hydrolase family protein [Sphingobium chungbukense]|uniref:Fumarylacetoacetase-like C-terminal domain-containing protein n=1 Tax=Sphingobium chungbukense TaxID=56193 RepID=A0A0M3ANA6_9SPHN|nr:fumarylacetoacetate hydrolase family protein [Sphingobium chungbukense]KKW91642.1 hypothetical protein YP76_14820 [Sphingobium chungbukense]
MKLATVAGASQPRLCVVLPGEQEVLDLQKAHQAVTGHTAPELETMHALMVSGQSGLDLAQAAIDHAVGRIEPEPLSSVRLLAPVPEPVQMRDALLFELHCVQAFQKARELRASRSPDPEAAMLKMEELGLLRVPDEFYQMPLYYKQNRFSVSGPEEDILWPRYSEVMDYELELGIFIGKGGMDIHRDKARDHIFGYTIFNDFSARDAQFAEHGGGLGPAKGKDFKGANAIGPWIVTADELPDPYNLEMVVRVNGKERGRGNSGSIYWPLEDVIARISDGEELRTGEFIGSGTVGNGSGLESMHFLEHGDVVELEVERIGVLRNRVLRQAEK